jgi:hypothetical protein
MEARLVLPDDFADYAWEVEAKGVFWDVFLELGERRIPVTFYEPTRLAQDVEEELLSYSQVLLSHVIVVKKVTVEEMVRSTASLPDDFFS